MWTGSGCAIRVRGSLLTTIETMEEKLNPASCQTAVIGAVFRLSDLSTEIQIQQPVSKIWYDVVKLTKHCVWFEDKIRNTRHRNHKTTVIHKINKCFWNWRVKTDR
jgi:hypothetical protein